MRDRLHLRRADGKIQKKSAYTVLLRTYPVCKPRGYHVDTTWLLRGMWYHVDTTWQPRGHYVVHATWYLSKNPRGVHVVATWTFPRGFDHVVATQIFPRGFDHVLTTWYPHRFPKIYGKTQKCCKKVREKKLNNAPKYTTLRIDKLPYSLQTHIKQYLYRAKNARCPY